MPVENAAYAAANVGAMASSLVKGAEAGALRFVVEVANEAKRLLSQPHTGPVYSRAPGRPGGNPASLPGEPPALQTGFLRSSVRWQQEGPGQWTVGTFEPGPGGRPAYGKYLEWGTSRMAARPFMRPAVQAVSERMPGVAVAEVAKAQGEARGRMGP